MDREDETARLAKALAKLHLRDPNEPDPLSKQVVWATIGLLLIVLIFWIVRYATR